ncbi:uncharacterized protein LACBIDRAFT_294799 [Laccaria bicolor S238N-H82]|uniref:Predicted protein n=1 Tax=Laccaria bicolor (strain S238N-H82 / ATCC MYA-4686) TaxID=486041 RepID=B0DIA3_LACBS|nr:uncharacterized protein LACBIDRAFT_294799 [Laccaria bicolor S238N-H82]EDR05649.1 predicted protein [Laccaria bicolor S238N-H82]|eukprot:XP_001883753.1 predicted protein [Laccaria bicolor S238N-H82]
MTWGSARQARFLDAPDAVEYLKRVKQHFTGDSGALATLLRRIRSWIETESTNPVYERSAVAIACILRTNPPLLHGFNSLLRKGYRIEFSNKVEIVDLFVWTTPAAAMIRSFSGSNVPNPGSAAELRDWLSLDHGLEDLLKLDYGKYGDEYPTCLSQLLQFIMDDTTTDTNPATASRCRRKALRFLRQLATKRSILPPSLFLNNLKREGSSGVQHAVGGGAFADIYKDRIQGTVFCFRVLQVLVWRQLKHPNILPFIGASTELFSPRFCFISLWMDRGDIMSYLKQNPRHDRFAAVCQIVDGVEYLHTLDPPITHKDIKGANVLVTDEGICCLADFGLSSIFDSQRVDKSPGLQGSICWLAPELMQPIYTGKPPFWDLPHSFAVMREVSIEKQRAPLPPEGTWTYEEEQLWVLVGQSWVENPEERYEIREIKNFLKDLVCDKTLEGPQGGSPSPSPETDSASEAARDLDRVRVWLDKELYGYSASLIGRTSRFADNHFDFKTPPRSRRSQPASQVYSGYRKQYAREDPSPYDTPASDLGGRAWYLGSPARCSAEVLVTFPATRSFLSSYNQAIPERFDWVLTMIGSILMCNFSNGLATPRLEISIKLRASRLDLAEVVRFLHISLGLSSRMSASMNSAQVQSLNGPDSIAYLECLKGALSELDADPIPLFHLLFDLVWRDRNSLKITNLIVQIASSLRSSRHLLRGLNIVLPKGFQVEINADLHDQSDFFVLVTPFVSRIVLVSGLKLPSPETNHELRNLLNEPQGINKLLETEASPAWFSAISQLLQNDIYTGKLGNKPVCVKALRIKSLVGSRFCLISPWMSNGNIMKYLSQHPNHDRFVSANILVNDKGVCYLADFGLASVAQSQRLDSSTGGIAGSMCWLAPEILRPDSTSDQDEKPRDIYAFACTIYEIFTGNPPFHDRGHGAMFAIIRGEWPALPPSGVWSTEEKNMWALVAKARAPELTERMKIREIKNALRGARISLEESRSTVADEGRQLIVDNENILNARVWLEKELSNSATGDAVVDSFTPSIEEGVGTPDFRDTRESSALGSLCPELRESHDLNDKGSPRGSPSTPSPLHLDFWNVRYTHGLATPISPSPSPLNPHAIPFAPCAPCVAVLPLTTAESLLEPSKNSSNPVTGEESTHSFQTVNGRLPETQIRPRPVPLRLKPTSPAFIPSAGFNRNILNIDIPSVTPPSNICDILQSHLPTPVSPPTTSQKDDVVFDCSALCSSLAYPPFGESAENCEKSRCSNHEPSDARISAAVGTKLQSQPLATTSIDSNTRSGVRKLSVKADAFFPMASRRSTALSPIMEVKVSPAGAVSVMPSISQGVQRKLDASVAVFVPRGVLSSLKQASTLDQAQLF